MSAFERKIRVAFAITACLCGCWRGAPVEMLSVNEVLESASSLSGKRVSVCGIARIAFEHTAIYPSVESASQGIGPSIWLDLDAESFHELNMKEVEVTGVFDEERKGHMGMFSGEIRPIESLRAVGSSGCHSARP